MAHDHESGLALRSQATMRLICQRSEAPWGPCGLRRGDTGGAHPRRHGLRARVPGRAVVPRADSAAARTDDRTAHSLVHRREGAWPAEILLKPEPAHARDRNQVLRRLRSAIADGARGYCGGARLGTAVTARFGQGGTLVLQL